MAKAMNGRHGPYIAQCMPQSIPSLGGFVYIIEGSLETRYHVGIRSAPQNTKLSVNCVQTCRTTELASFQRRLKHKLMTYE